TGGGEPACPLLVRWAARRLAQPENESGRMLRLPLTITPDESRCRRTCRSRPQRTYALSRASACGTRCRRGSCWLRNDRGAAGDHRHTADRRASTEPVDAALPERPDRGRLRDGCARGRDSTQLSFMADTQEAQPSRSCRDSKSPCLSYIGGDLVFTQAQGRTL